MTSTRFSPRVLSNRRPNHLAVVVLADATIAFQACRLLHRHGISPENLAIVGAGYNTPESVGLVGPLRIARRRAMGLSCKAVALSFGLVLILARLGGMALLPALWGALLAGVVGAVLGAAIGSLVSLWGEGSRSHGYRRQVQQGRYLLLVEGPEALVQWGQEVLNHYYLSSAVQR